MKTGRYETSCKRRSNRSKSLALVLSLVLVIGCVTGGTLAWLNAKTDEVKNTFSTSDIGVTLEETTNTYKMIPGWTIAKDPKATVSSGSEDCWLFVKITESTTPDLDAYISYAIATGWEIVEPTNTNGTLATISTLADKIVIGRKVHKDDTTKTFNILGAGEYTDPMDVDDTTDDFKITWGDNQVCVKPTVTEKMMDEANPEPTLTFTAYAVQLMKNNTTEFTAAEAWELAQSLNTAG